MLQLDKGCNQTQRGSVEHTTAWACLKKTTSQHLFVVNNLKPRSIDKTVGTSKLTQPPPAS